MDTQQIMDDARNTVLKLVESSAKEINDLPENARLTVQDLGDVQKALNDLQVKCKLECLEIEKKYHDLQRPLFERLQDLTSGKLQRSGGIGSARKARENAAATIILGIPNFWLTVLNNHLAFRDLIEEHDRDVLKQLANVRIKYLSSSGPTPGPGYRLLFEFGPNDYFENQVLSKTYRFDDRRTGSSGNFVYVSAIGTKIEWKKGMSLTQRVDGNLRFSFFHFFDPVTKEEFTELLEEEEDEEWLAALKDEIEDDYELGAALKDQIIPHAVGWFTGEACPPVIATANSQKAAVLQSPKRGPKYGYKGILRDASTGLGGSLLLLGAQLGHISVVKLLIERGDVDINSQDDEGRTPLFSAAQNGHADVVKLLTSAAGININSPMNNGDTPLFSAAFHGHSEVVKVLIGATGIDINSRVEYGGTPLLIAARHGHAEVAKLLIGAASIEVNSRLKDGSTALYIAAYSGHSKVVKLLIDIDSINVNLPDEDGRTPLYIAAEKGHSEVVKLLIGVDGIDLNLGRRGSTPYSIAVQKGHKAIETLLEPAVVPGRSNDWSMTQR